MAILESESERRILRIDPTQGPLIASDRWRRLSDEDALPEDAALPLLLSPARAQGERALLDARLGPWGIYSPGEADPEPIAAAFLDRPIIALVVAKFTDGRHFSTARLLRERYGYAGDLRALGAVLPDQLQFMRRCGYSSFELAAGKSLETGLRTITQIAVGYQR